MKIKIGKFTIYPLLDGYFYLDRALMIRRAWNERLKLYRADLQQRMKLASRCFLVVGKNILLFDTGIGDPFDPSFKPIGKQMYRDFLGIDQKEGNLIDNLFKAGLSTEDINLVSHSHLHFDHTGWNLRTAESGCLVPTFPNAKYVLSRLEWNETLWEHPATLHSYRKEAFLPIAEAGLAEVAWETTEVESGLLLANTGGHTPGHWQLFINSYGKTAVMAGDLFPTHKHINPGLTMSYDLNQTETVNKKLEFLEKAASEKWLILFDHDPDYVGGYVENKTGKYKFKPVKFD